MTTTPAAIMAAAAIAMRVEMLRIFIFLWRRVLGFDAGWDKGLDEELGFNTIGLGRTAGQDMLRAEPQRPGLSIREETGIVLKKVPVGISPDKRLWEMLKEMRGRSERFLGIVPVSLFWERSTDRRWGSSAIVGGIGPVRLFCERSLHAKIIKVKTISSILRKEGSNVLNILAKK